MPWYVPGPKAAGEQQKGGDASDCQRSWLAVCLFASFSTYVEVGLAKDHALLDRLGRITEIINVRR